MKIYKLKVFVPELVKYLNTINEPNIKGYLASVAWWNLSQFPSHTKYLVELKDMFDTFSYRFDKLDNATCIRAEDRAIRVMNPEIREFYKQLFKKQVLYVEE